MASVDLASKRLPIRLARRLARAVVRPPTLHDLIELTVAALAVGVMLAVLAGDFLTAHSVHPRAGLEIAVAAFFIPALSEEAVFRGLLVPSRDEPVRPTMSLLLSTGLFTAWHVVEALTFLPGAAVLFLQPDFLASAALLGLACGILRWRSGSLWTAVLLHWSVVVVWQALLGGPPLAALR